MSEAAADNEEHHAPKWLTWVTRISLVVGIGALIATVWIVGPTTILHHLKQIGWFFVVLVAIEMLSSVLDGLAIYFMAHGKGRPTMRESIVAQIAGRGVNSVTPGGNLGEALKVGLLSKRCSTRRIVAAVMYVGLIGVLLSFAVVSIGSAVTAFWFDMPGIARAACLVGAVIAAGITVAIIVLLRRGMLSTLSNLLARIHIISKKRRASWNKTLTEVDARLRGKDDGDYRRRAIACVAVSQLLQKGLAYFTILSAGYTMSPGQFLALLSAGVLIGWISTIIPMGLGISEGGNAALFTLIGAPAALGLALALARRVNQVVFAAVGFVVLAADRVGTHVHGRITTRSAKPKAGFAKPRNAC
ncbi:MAG TPA: lysylphosphatidylglycerol synthase transmembrane domain-containing protein [Kofleriaceae bacterium]